uniref:Uncharacterized protein n=1 Tax=Anguilla anguilla TaxID=7936 RepID=A0A0E9SHP7_ANGAN
MTFFRGGDQQPHPPPDCPCERLPPSEKVKAKYGFISRGIIQETKIFR